MSAIRPIAIGIFRRDEEILVGHAHDVLRGEHYCRPPGGGIEFGERAAETLRREIFVFEASFQDPGLYALAQVPLLLALLLRPFAAPK